MVEVQAPSGSFTPDLAAAGQHVLIAAGTGSPRCCRSPPRCSPRTASPTVTLLYGNRRSDSVMFADELADLKDAYPARLRLVHVLSREPQEVELFNGRLDAAKLRALLPVTVDVAGVDHWWLCGPFGMVTDAIDGAGRAGRAAASGSTASCSTSRTSRRRRPVTPDAPPGPGRRGHRPARRPAPPWSPCRPGMPLLDGAQRVRPDLPFACKGGVCGTCRARLVTGEVTMRRNYALEEDELAAGYVLTCQSVAASSQITVDYDS